VSLTLQCGIISSCAWLTRAVDTVGARDAFASGFPSFFLQEHSALEGDLAFRLPAALERGNFIGALTRCVVIGKER